MFKKETSVFAKWKADDDKIMQKCLLEHDFLHWKLEKFVKEDDERQAVEAIFREHFSDLKNIFLELACESAFPAVT